ncbi:hypothetical protein Tco_0203075 [Tanacetum coccineum]
MGRILKTVCLRWVPTGKLLNSCTGTSFNDQKQQRIDITTDALYNEKQENLRFRPRSSWTKWCLLKITLLAPFLNVQKTFDRSRSSLGLHGNDVCSHQFRPRSSSNDV